MKVTRLLFGSRLRQAALVPLLAGLACQSYQAERAASGEEVTARRVLMGTLWEIRVAQTPKGNHLGKAVREAFEEVARIERVMSEWQTDSPLSAINAAAGREMVEVPRELQEILQRSTHFGRLTGGAFDVTWRGMGRLWRFDDEFRVPNEEEIQEASARVDFRKIRMEDDRVGLPEEGMAIGLGGMAKGYALDRAGEVLRGAGLENFFIDGGGDILARGSPDQRPWRLGIRDPRGNFDDLIAIVELASGAVATSGDYERFRIADGVRYHHIIDPRTGRPANLSRSATVVAPTGEEADVLATAIFILGAEEGLALARRKGVEALVVDARGGLYWTEGFGRLARLTRR